MNAAQYISIAISRWILSNLHNENDFAREGLPIIDLETFFQQLAIDSEFSADQFSIAIAGMGKSTTDLQELAIKARLNSIIDFTDDLHVAAEWRNNRNRHPRTIALASGYNAGVHTLGHYAWPASSDLAIELLEDYYDNLPIRYPQSPEVHRHFVAELLRNHELTSLLSFEACAEFLAKWDTLRSEISNRAPLFALPKLGLLVDQQLFSADNIGKRLVQNLQTIQLIRTFRASALRTVARRQYRNPDRQNEMAEAVTALEDYLTGIQRGEERSLELNQALLIVRPPKDEPEPEPESEDEEDQDTNDINDENDTRQIKEAASEALLEGIDDDLRAISEAYDEAWANFNEHSDTQIEILTTLPSKSEEFEEIIQINPSALVWINAFCSEEIWGGYIESTESSLESALENAADNLPEFNRPDSIDVIEGESISLSKILKDWDEDIKELAGAETHLYQSWIEIRELRNNLLPHLGKLIYHPRSWIDGKPDVLANLQRYLELAGKIYLEIQENYRVMASGSQDWARIALEALLSLDVVQIRVRMSDGSQSAKAVLLPTHPLYLWRNERLSTLLRGLSKSTNLDQEDRITVRTELERPEQFLSVIRLGSIPKGKGLNQLLPLTSEIEGLPVFENLLNACSGADGTMAFKEALDQYIILYPNHPFPLRVSIVNPPQPEKVLMGIVQLLNTPRYRSGHRLGSIYLSIYATTQHADRLRASLRFSDQAKEDAVQEKIAAGRLQIEIIEECLQDHTTLSEVVDFIKRKPCHVAAIFDESTIRIRQRSVGHYLQMSPFCVRYDIQIDRRSGKIDLAPQPGESPFSEFFLMMNELEGNQRDATPHAYADAEALAETSDEVLQGNTPASNWLFLADRALPSEAGMQSVRIWERREGMRDTFLATRDFSHLSRLIRPVFSRCNLTVTPEHMASLLHQGARLLGSGILDIIKKQDGQPDQKKVIGFAGLLMTARYFQRMFPGALVLSVDHPLARLWLKIGKRSLTERCDLITFWRDQSEGHFKILASEVKATDGNQLNNPTVRLTHAKKQILSTLEAIRDGLDASSPSRVSPLSIPRCEMLKQTLVNAAQAKTGDAHQDRLNRRRWGNWLKELFDVPTNETQVEISGSIVSVLLRRADQGIVERVPTNSSWELDHHILGEMEIEELLCWNPCDDEPSLICDDRSDEGEALDYLSTPESISLDDNNQRPSRTDIYPPETTPREQLELTSQKHPQKTADRLHSLTSATQTKSNEQEDWPPTINALGMIGQYQEVERLVEQAIFAKTTQSRFSDKLLVGPAGVGKSTLARKIAELLLNQEPIFFNGSDLRRPNDLIERLVLEGKVPDKLDEESTVVATSLLFIDEVHGISSSVATVLLSAMDDRRETSIDGHLYSFTNVVFLLATTDQGRLSEAFQSRPNKTWLRPYTVHELAGIVWLRGKESLDGTELSKEACYEIAARTQCNPRRSVRALTEILRPHFFSRAMQKKGSPPTMEEVAELMNADSIGSFYDSQGIDFNGIDDLSRRFLTYLKKRGPASESTLSQALGLTHRRDFIEVTEYLVRLGLIETTSAGRRLTRDGNRYLTAQETPDLRDRISRAIN